MSKTNLSSNEIEKLSKFREIAQEVRNSSIIDKNLTPHIHINLTEEKYEEVFNGVPNEALRSLGVAIRQVYMKKGDANFRKIHNILYQKGNEEIRNKAITIYDVYKKILTGIDVEVIIEDKKYKHEEILKNWFDGSLVHQDSDKKDQLRRLSQLGGLAELVLEKILIQMADCILQFDDVVADLVGQARLPKVKV